MMSSKDFAWLPDFLDSGEVILNGGMFDLEKMRAERGVDVDHSSINRWVQKFTPQLEATFRKGNKRLVDRSWRMDETL